VQRAPQRLSWILDPLLLLVITLGFYWKLTLTNQYTWLDSPDLVYQALPWFQFQSAEFHQGHLPLWDPHHWGGQSLIGQLQPGTAYPLNWILFSLPLRDGRIRLGYLDAYFLLIHFLGALFAYWLCRDLRRTRAASLLAAVFFSLGGFLGSSTWPGIINGVIWVPLIFLFLLRAARGRHPWSSTVLSGVFTGAAFLSGHHLVPTLILLTTGGVWLYLILRDGRPNWKLARLAALAVLFTLLIGALQILPAFEYGTRAIRWVGAPDAIGWNQRVPYSVHSEFSMHAYSLLGILVPGIFLHENPFVGLTAASLAFLGLALGWRRRPVRVLAAVALAGLLFALGRDNVLHGILYGLVPMVEKAREPVRAIFIFHFGIIALIAWGLDRLRRDELWLRRVAVVLAVVGILAILMFTCIAIANKSKVTFDDQGVLTSVIALLLAGIFYGIFRGHLSRTAAGVCLLGLLLIELGNGSSPAMSEKPRAATLNKLKVARDVAWFLRSQPGAFRVEVDDQEIPYNFGDWHGFDDTGGYFPSVPMNVWRMGAMADRRVLYGVRYTVTKKPPEANQELVFQSAEGLKVYRNPNAFPRVWTVHRVVANPDPSLDLRQTAFLSGPAPALQPCSSAEDQVRLFERESSRVVIEVDMKCTGMVVLSDNHFPGWQANVDGRPAEILPAYFSMRGVVVPAGRHRVEMRYRPISVYLGASLTGLGLLVTVFLLFRDRRRVVNYG
jgi:hypothetical protein